MTLKTLQIIFYTLLREPYKILVTLKVFTIFFLFLSFLVWNSTRSIIQTHTRKESTAQTFPFLVQLQHTLLLSLVVSSKLLNFCIEKTQTIICFIENLVRNYFFIIINSFSLTCLFESFLTLYRQSHTNKSVVFK